MRGDLFGFGPVPAWMDAFAVCVFLLQLPALVLLGVLLFNCAEAACKLRAVLAGQAGREAAFRMRGASVMGQGA